jgi:hypothetical protein
VIDGDFEWDDQKARNNLAKHGVSFEEAQSALVDPAAVFFSDDDFDEERFIAIGMSIRARLDRRPCGAGRAHPHHFRSQGDRYGRSCLREWVTP